MGYKTIQTFITEAKRIEETLAPATALAAALDAHLEVMVMGIQRLDASAYYGGVPVIVQQNMLDQVNEEVTQIETAAREYLGRQDARWGLESAIVQQGGMGSFVALRSRFSDLAVLPKPYGDKAHPDAEAIVEACLFDAGVPVLITPEAPSAIALPRRIVVGWNQSNEAMHAVRLALPFLQAAETVNIAVIDPPSHGPERSDPGGPLAQMLARHGVRAEVSVVAKTEPWVSTVLARHVADMDADMLVMGAYGHSRFRQAILGGATRNMLEAAKVPLFMAH